MGRPPQRRHKAIESMSGTDKGERDGPLSRSVVIYRGGGLTDADADTSYEFDRAIHSRMKHDGATQCRSVSSQPVLACVVFKKLTVVWIGG